MVTKTNNKKYNVELNMVRGICVLIVIMVHLLTPIYNDFFVYFTSYILLVFFFLSGYFLKSQPFNEQFQKRLGTLVKQFTIYFSTISISCGIILIIKDGISVIELSRSILSELLGREFLNFFFPGVYTLTALHRPLTVNWFFFQLILATAISMPILGRCKNSIPRKAIYTIICLFISAILYSHFKRMPLQLQMLFFEVAIMIIGNIAHQLGIFSRSYISDNITRIELIAGLSLISCLLYIENPNPAMMSHGQIGSYNNIIDVVTALIQMIIGAVSLYETCILMRKSQTITKALDWIGSNSIEYVYMHMVFAWILSLFGMPIALDLVRTKNYTGSISQIIVLILLFIFNIFLCTVYSKLHTGLFMKHKKIADNT